MADNTDDLLNGKEIEPNGLYDFSFRKVPSDKVQFYRGLPGQLTVNPDDKYRLQAWYGDELGHNEQVVLQSDLQDGTTEFSLAFKNASVAVLSKEIDNTTLTLDAQEYGIAVLDVSNSNTISLKVPSKAGTKLQLIIKNLTDDAKLTFKSEKEINWSGSAVDLPTELNKFYSVIFTYTGVYWEAEQNTSTIHAEHAKKADEAETAYKMAKLVVKLTGAATGSGVLTDDDELTVNVEKIDLLNVLEINAEIPKVNKNHIYLDTVNSHFWVFDYTTTFKWLDLFTVLNTQLAAFDLRLIDLEKLSIGDNLTYLRNHMDNAEANIIQNQQDIDKLEDRATSLEDRATKVESRATSLETRATDLESRATKVEDRATSLETRADANDTTNVDFETRISTNTTNISNLDSRVTVNEGNIKTNTDNISSIDARVTVTENNFTKLDQRVNNIETSTDVGALAAKITTMENTMDTHGTNIQANADAISTEASDRATADTALEGKVSDEVTARTNADTALESKISDEVIARTNADTELQATLETKISNEVAARTNANAELQATLETKISDEAKARETADTALAESVKNDIQPKLDALSGDVSKNYLKLSGGTMVTEGTAELKYSLSGSATATREGDYYTFSLADDDSVTFAPSSGNVVLGNLTVTKATTSFNLRLYDSIGWRWYILVTFDDTTETLTTDLSNLSSWTLSAYQPNHTDETEEKPTTPQFINNEVEEIILVKDTDTKTTESITISIDFCNCKETTETISEEWSAKRIKEFSNKLDSSISELKSDINTKVDEFTTSITNQLNTQNTDVTDKLATVVTLTGDQTITGNKLFENTSSSVTTATADVVIDNTSPDNIILPKLTTTTDTTGSSDSSDATETADNTDSSDSTDSTETTTPTSYSITINNGATNTAWTKCIKLEDSASTISFGDAWNWVGGDAPELVNNCLLIAKWCGDFGLANVISVEG